MSKVTNAPIIGTVWTKTKYSRDYVVNLCAMIHRKKILSCITPTGDRPEALKLCAEYIRRQTFQGFEWIIIDDGVVPISFVPDAKIIRAEPKDEVTLSRNLLLGLEVAQGDFIAFIEDDDWYSPGWLESALRHFQNNPECQIYFETHKIVMRFLATAWSRRIGTKIQMEAQGDGRRHGAGVRQCASVR